MKYFKCGKCQTPYKIDETKISTGKVAVTCSKCQARNILRLGPILVVQYPDKILQFNLKEGVNLIGRSTEGSGACIKIKDKYISRKHAEVILEKINDKVFVSIRDTGSMNGTFTKTKQRLKSGVKYPFTPNDYYIVGLAKLMFKKN